MPQHRLNFLSARHLKEWLVKSPGGKKILAQIQQDIHVVLADAFQNKVRAIILKFIDKFYHDRTRVVVELHADGWVQVYGPKEMSVKIVQRPRVFTPEAEIFVDKMIEEDLPLRYRELYYPGNVRASGQVQDKTGHRLLDEAHERHCLEAIR